MELISKQQSPCLCWARVDTKATRGKLENHLPLLYLWTPGIRLGSNGKINNAAELYVESAKDHW